MKTRMYKMLHPRYLRMRSSFQSLSIAILLTLRSLLGFIFFQLNSSSESLTLVIFPTFGFEDAL